MQTFIDHNGVNIALTEEGENHILLKHPEMAEYMNEIAGVLISPNVVLPDSRPNVWSYYRRIVGSKRLRVVVKILPDKAFVLTAFTTYRVR